MLYAAFILGVISSLHCIGMCGPIAMMLPVDRNNEAKKIFQMFLYHFGRITAYAVLGLLFGIMGKGLFLAGWQQEMSIIAGILMIAIALVPEKIFSKYNFSKPVYHLISKVKTSLGTQFRKRSYKALYITGLLNGFLPCGLVYAALFGALAMQNIPLGILYMILYGTGTIPLMSAVVYAAGMVKAPLRNTLNKIVPYTVVFIGMLFIVRGLGLSIPYLSPGDMSLFVQETPVCK